ncbi:MAG: hypothetical protein D8M59_03685 [Planctomycetes bacterium]|nr:hypothetical protein [Planctomycetota bacterium]NOG53098.1 hypothetical protein [Planctomycetota bacterium]
MNSRRIVGIAIVILLALTALVWLRGEGRNDFDLRTVVPFMRSRSDSHVGVNLYDYAGLALLIMAGLGLARLSFSLRQTSHDPSPRPARRDDDTDPDDIDHDVVPEDTGIHP